MKRLLLIFFALVALEVRGVGLNSAVIRVPGYTRGDPLTNFPVLVAVSNNSPAGFYYSQCNTGGYDIAFSTNGVALNSQCDTWNTNGYSYFWVQVPLLTNNAGFTMTWKDPSVTTYPVGWTNGNTWTGGYAGVWHMSGGSTDSSSFRNNGTEYIISAASGFVGGARQSTTNSYISISGTALNGSAGTIEMVVNHSVTNSFDNVTYVSQMLFVSPDSANRLYFYFTTNGWLSCNLKTFNQIFGPYVPTQQWTHVALRYTTSTQEMFVNGVLAGSAPVNGPITIANPVYLCAYNSTARGDGLRGFMDEARLSTVTRSTNWIWAGYQTVFSNSTFQDYATVALVPHVVNSGGATGITVNSAWLDGTLVTTGTSASVWGVIWGTNNPGATLNGWLGGGIHDFGAAAAENVSTSYQATALSGGLTYYYSFWATNGAGTNVTVPSSFIIPAAGPFRMQIALGGYTNRTEVLTNFPALVVFSNGMGGTDFHFQRYPFLSTNGWDLRFSSDAAATNSLNYEIEQWNTNGPCYVWVQVPSIAGDGTGGIWARWGADSNQLACTTNGATWDSLYGFVYHMNDSGSTIADSTTNRINGVCFGNTHAVTNLIGLSQDFDGTGDYITNRFGRGLNPSTQRLTYQAWVRSDVPGSGNNKMFFSQSYPVSANERAYFGHTGGNWDWGIHTNGWGTGSNAGTADTGNHLVAIVFTNSAAVFYLDGVAKATKTYTNYSFTTNFSIGTYLLNNSYDWDGRIDEVRASTTNRPADWLWAEFMNQGSNSAFISCGQAEMDPLPVLNNSAGATGITANAAWLNGSLVSTGASSTVWGVLWGTNNPGATTAGWLGGGTQTFGVAAAATVATSFQATALTPGTTYYYSYWATNAAGTNVAVPVSFTAFLLPVVNNDAGATGITALNAVIRGSTTAGIPTPAAYLCLKSGGAGTSDTGTWDCVISCGTLIGSFASTVSGLTPGSIYYYQAYATNAAGGVWSGAASNFTTLSASAFNLASNHNVGSGGALAGVSPAVTLSAVVGWRYDFGASGFTNLNMGAFSITNSNGSSIILDLAAGPLSATSGDLLTARSASSVSISSGSVTVSNAQNVAIDQISTDIGDSSSSGSSGSISVWHRGSFIGNLVSSHKTTSGGLNGRITFDGDAGTASGAKGTFWAGRIDSSQDSWRDAGGSGDITISNYTSVVVTGAVKSCVTLEGPYGDIRGGNVAVGGTSATSRITYDITVGSIDAHATSHNNQRTGSVKLYAGRDVLIQNASGVRGNISTYAGDDPWDTWNGGAGLVVVNHDGRFAVSNVLSYATTMYGGDQSYNGDYPCDGASGAFEANILSAYRGPDRSSYGGPPGNITVSGYTSITVNALYTSNLAAVASGGNITLAASGAIRLGAVDTHATAAAIYAGDLTASTTNGSIYMTNSLTLDAASGGAFEGDLVLTAGGANSTIWLTSLDMNVVYLAKLAPYKYSYVQSFSGTAGTDLRTDAGKKVFYGGGGTAITQLQNISNTGNGGYLCPWFGESLVADDGNSAGVFGPAVTSRVSTATGYDGLRSSCATTTNSGGSGRQGTSAVILYGSASVQSDVSMQWRTRLTGETNQLLVSDVLNLGGTGGGDTFVLEMSYSEAAITAAGLSESLLAAKGRLLIRKWNGTRWIRAGAGEPMLRGWTAADTSVGSWGVDTAANVAWIVLDQQGVYAVGLTMPYGAIYLVH